MKILKNDPTFKLIDSGANLLLLIALPQVTGRDQKDKIVPVDLRGLGHTTADATTKPWLITCTDNRASYIFFEGEKVSSSYVMEKLHIYSRPGAKLAAEAIHEVFNKQ